MREQGRRAEAGREQGREGERGRERDRRREKVRHRERLERKPEKGAGANSVGQCLDSAWLLHRYTYVLLTCIFYSIICPMYLLFLFYQLIIQKIPHVPLCSWTLT
jgi:hypothetical protein